MKIDNSGLVLEKGFDQATAIVKDAFANRGFKVTTAEIGRERNAACPEQPRRYLNLCAMLPELTFERGGNNPTSVLGCNLSVIELNDGLTLVAAEPPLAPYPLLSRLVPRVTHRVDEALAHLTRYVAVHEAA